MGTLLKLESRFEYRINRIFLKYCILNRSCEYKINFLKKLHLRKEPDRFDNVDLKGMFKKITLLTITT
jgi:hypothetical protein